VLERLNLKPVDVGLFELNEALAVVAMAATPRWLSIDYRCEHDFRDFP
jgi:hypothetical protein